jgi:saccharopine dehydrogenase (NAD+, L-lysine-forming)
VSTPRLLIYGAYGYNGALCAREAHRRGLNPILAGRQRAPLEALAEELDLEHRVFSLRDGAQLRQGLDGVSAVLHAAGPYSATWEPMVEACLASRTSYFDITGEIDVIEGVLGCAERARAAEVVLMPAVGFDVIPTDCLAAMLAHELPEAVRLDLAFYGGGKPSRGTMRSIIEGLGRKGRIRRDGEIVDVPQGWRRRTIPFPGGDKLCMTIPWGDVASAYHSTGIGNVVVYSRTTPLAARLAPLIGGLSPLLALAPVQRAVKALAATLVSNPDYETRKTRRVEVWGRVEDAEGRSCEGALSMPEGITMTSVGSVEAARRCLAGEIEAGAWTPSVAFGRDFVLSLPGVERTAWSGVRPG